ncbi:unnamed protein product [Ilex paraguariensis]|uniref:Uncharacterized protein n=1 Tax=Ilex paraguariensis TaxID=185542 RepID=A0ABC8U2B4_9AQUA
MASAQSINGGDEGEKGDIEQPHVVEMVATTTDDGESISDDQITPLLAQSEKPKINIFSVSYPRRKPIKKKKLEAVMAALLNNLKPTTFDLLDMEQVTRFAEMETSPVKQFILWAWSGSSIQRLPLSQAITLSFTTPIMASSAARIILREKLKITEMGGGLAKAGEATNSYANGSHHMYAVLIGLFASIAGGISCCLIRAGAKTSDQPVVTVFSFSILASPASVICNFAFQEFVLPGFYSFILMVVLGVLAFFAEIFLARGLQLEKTSRVANIQYLEAVLSQLWGIGLSRVVPSFGRLVGCSLILLSAFCTMYIGPEKEME